MIGFADEVERKGKPGIIAGICDDLFDFSR